MTRLLYLTNRSRGSTVGGREQLSRLHRQVLRELFGDRLFESELDGQGGASAVLGYIDGVSQSAIARVCDTIAQQGIGLIFLDGSNLGRIAEGIKNFAPTVQVCTFFHNCEAKFFLGAARRSPGLKSAGVLMANYIAERKAVRFSDKRLALNQRDSSDIERIYGRAATHLFPMALADQVSEVSCSDMEFNLVKPGYALFVGGAFYANLQGIRWYCEHVAPHVPLRTVVVGKGLDKFRAELEVQGGVEVVGPVDSLAPWYAGAAFVVAPIFEGSGMKTKVAEALMYGKRVIGTPEAFTGYEDVASCVGSICSSEEDFVRAIVREAGSPHAGMDPNLRLIYEQRYSLNAARRRLALILGVSDSLSEA